MLRSQHRVYDGVAKWHVRRTAGAPKAIVVALSFCRLLGLGCPKQAIAKIATPRKATINLAHNLGLHVTAEGVESKEIMDKLKKYGCNIAQGHYLSKPFSVSDFNQWMVTSKWQLALVGSQS